MDWPRSRGAVLALLLTPGCAFGGDAADATADAAAIDGGRRDSGFSDAASMDAEPEDAGGTADAAVIDAGQTGPRVEVGTGSFQFEPLTEGQVIDFSAGPQGGGRYGGFHIWFGARIWELEPDAISVSFIPLLASDRSELGRLDWVTNFRETTTDAYEIWGATPRLEDCCAVRSQRILMRVEVLDARGESAAKEIEVIGADQCIDLSGDVCP